jgi:uncharacterized damage-inducible protein DinB
MKKSSYLPGVIFLFFICFIANPAAANNSFAAPAEDSLKAQMIRDWERAKKSTKEFLDAMPEDGTNFKPTAEMRSFAEQMLHLSAATMNMVTFATGVERTIYKENLEKEDKYKNKAALHTVVMESYDWIISTIRGLDASKLFLPSKANPKFSCYAVMASAYEHQTHHRSQTVVYLRLKGITPPREKLF